MWGYNQRRVSHTASNPWVDHHFQDMAQCLLEHHRRFSVTCILEFIDISFMNSTERHHREADTWTTVLQAYLKRLLRLRVGYHFYITSSRRRERFWPPGRLRPR
jgi:hypothetical protein